MDLEDANPKMTPAPREALGRDLEGNPFSQEFNYASVVGMLMYLCNNSRPDIAFTVNQCARYTHFPTEKHGLHLKQIGKYLKKTRDKGLILKPKPQSKLKIDCYVDADFAGLWNKEDKTDLHCIRSRTGFTVKTYFYSTYSYDIMIILKECSFFFEMDIFIREIRQNLTPSQNSKEGSN